jgi:hypothetical protein
MDSGFRPADRWAKVHAVSLGQAIEDSGPGIRQSDLPRGDEKWLSDIRS